VFHDSYKSQKNMEYALPRLVDFLGGKGYSFGAVPDSAGDKGIKV
jgi:hypothetical protein